MDTGDFHRNSHCGYHARQRLSPFAPIHSLPGAGAVSCLSGLSLKKQASIVDLFADAS
jgi:hypothetical protein